MKRADWNDGLFIACMELFELFLDQHPPARKDRRAWNRLERIAWRLHGHSANTLGGSPGAQLHGLRDVLRCCQECLQILRTVTHAPVTLLAFRRLQRIVNWIDVGLETVPTVMAS